MAYGNSQARGQIEAAAASLHPSHSWGLSRLCDLHPSSWQRQISNPWRKARDQTCVVMDTSWICFHCTRMDTQSIIC